MTFPEDSCKHWTLGCTLRSSWISPGPDHYVAREIGHRNRAKSQWAAGEAAPVTSFQSTLSSEGNRAAPCLSAQLSCFLSTTAGQERQSLPEPSRPSLLSRDQTWPSSPSPAPGVCFVNTSVEQERTKPARTKTHPKPRALLPAETPRRLHSQERPQHQGTWRPVLPSR
ncbi:uncharacterized protein LOC129634548 isoform X13 [Bubalus kerabau]|uniref:uncharacterized protein LOC129634548 isoform X13 n=1 Tax=Bubalus carabanensis TaxID=3119969 RepID=UPI00244E9141|nr:uncharacterized protein LOC129634548 isoform X13 [Bubalus carabanensis]